MSEIRGVLEELSGEDLEGVAPETTFFDQGFDSLLLTQVVLTMSKRFGVKLKLKQLAEEYPSTAALATYLESIVDPSRFADAPAAERAPVSPTAPRNGAAEGEPVRLPGPAAGSRRELIEAVVRQQLALMGRQLEMLGSAGASPTEAIATAIEPVQIPAETPVSAPSAAEVEDKPVKAHGPALVIQTGKGPNLTPTQEKHLSRLIERYAQKTAGSKAFTARNRLHVSDPRTAAGFKPALKELVYPIVVRRSSGCRLWDVDGNEYVDLLSGYGSNFFGFGAPFIRKAISDQMELGMEIGPQAELVEEVTALFREFIPADRVAYCNTGSEAVLATLRMARTATGRDLIVMFAGGYHGMFDEVVVRGTKKGSVPAAPGIPTESVANILVLPWAEPESLEVVRRRADEIAGVIVEPVQSRAPEIQPKEFLLELRRITEQTGSALIFDEVVCGFRVAPGGGQEYYGISPDIASYGKVVGGGVSIGIVAGRSEYMDTLDGGQWSYGDASVPEAFVTYFAGTFVRHPICLAAARAALLHMKAEGPALQRRVNEKTDRFVAKLNRVLGEQQAPLEVRHFSSVLKWAHLGESPFGELLFHHLRERGVHVWDHRPCFLTDAHTEADLDQVVDALRSAVTEMQDGEFYPRPLLQHRADAPPVAGAKLGRDANGVPTWYLPDPEVSGRYRPVGVR